MLFVDICSATTRRNARPSKKMCVCVEGGGAQTQSTSTSIPCNRKSRNLQHNIMSSLHFSFSLEDAGVSFLFLENATRSHPSRRWAKPRERKGVFKIQRGGQAHASARTYLGVSASLPSSGAASVVTLVCIWGSKVYYKYVNIK